MAGAACVTACLAAALAVRPRAPAIACGTMILFVALLPAGNVLFPTGVIMAERLLYLPSAGFCLAAAGAIAWLVRRTERFGPRGTLAACCAAAAILGTPLAARSVVRTADWRDPLTLFSATVTTSPHSAMAWFGLGHARHMLGDDAGALEAYRKSLDIAPYRSGTHFNLGRLHERAGRIDAAIASYEAAIGLDPSYQQALNNLGILHQAAGRLEQAETYYRRAAGAGVPRSEPAYNLGTVLESRGKAEEAMQWYREAARIEPRHVMALNNLGRLLLVAGRTDEAIVALESAIAARPGAPLPRVNLAAAWYAKGDVARAESLVTAVLADHPDDEAALRMLQAIRGR
jgi:tetratricopeptide (TPR) repeat protein